MRQHYPLNSQGAEDAGTLPWTDGVPSTGTEGSYFGHALFTDSEAEILAAIDASGQARNGSDLTQLIQAIARGVYVGQFSGTANALAAALPNGVIFASLLRNTRLGGFVTTTNTGGVTVAISGIGPRTAPGTVTAPLLRRNGTALQAGDLPVNQDFEIRWDGNAFRMAGSVASDGGGSGSDASSPTYPANRNAMSLIPAGVQTISNNMETAIAFGAPAAGADPLGFWNASDPTRITNPAGGPARMRISAALAFTANANGKRYARLVQNGGAVWQNGRVADRAPTSGQICVCQVTGFPSTIALNPGDYFQLFGFQDSGGSLNTDYGTSGANQTACKLVLEW